MRYGSIGGLEYEVPQSRLYCLCINVALCSTALQCVCRVIRRSSMTTKAHTYYIIFGRPPIGEASPFPPLAAPLVRCLALAVLRQHVAVAVAVALTLVALSSSLRLKYRKSASSLDAKRRLLCVNFRLRTEANNWLAAWRSG